MYKVYLVDDEKWVLDELACMINWQKYGFEICGYTVFPETAEKEILRLRPNIVFTDICMPGTDGLKLVKRLTDQLPYTYFCFVSAHDNFDFAKTAIGLRAVGYLLKPVQEEEIVDIIVKVKEKLGKDKNEIFDSFFLGTMKNYKEAFYALGIEPKNTPVTIIGLSGNTEADPAAFCKEAYSLYQSREEQIYAVTELRKEAFSEYFQARAQRESFGIGISAPIKDIADEQFLRRSIKQAKYASRQHFINGRYGVKIYEENVAYFKEAEQLRMELEQAETGSEFLYLLKALEGKIRKWDATVDVAGEFYFSCIRKIYDFSGKIKDSTEMSVITEKYASLREMAADLIRQAEEESENEIPNKVIAEIVNDVKADLARKSSLAAYAEKYAYNASWLSQLFKKYMGVTFAGYVVNLRIETAKKYILAGELSFCQIAASVGYDDYFHFSKIFKKYTGYSPKKFRENVCKKKNK